MTSYEFDISGRIKLFDACKEKHKVGMNNLIQALKERHNINYKEDQDNVIFIHNNKENKIAKEIFYRVSGQCVVFTTQIIKNKAEDVLTPMTDEMFYAVWKGRILDYFKLT